MPVLVPLTPASTPPPVVVPPTTPPADPAEQLQRPRITWADADGLVWDLDHWEDGRAILEGGPDGWQMLDRELIFDRMPSGGALLRAIDDSEQLFVVPLTFYGATGAEYRSRTAAFRRACSHKRGGRLVAGVLRVELPDGTWRASPAYYSTGLKGVEDPDGRGILCPSLTWQRPDPYWTGPETTREWTPAAGLPWFPILPLVLGSETVLGPTYADVEGDADAWPVWEITGPATPTITNATTGEEFAFADQIPSGRTVTVDTRPLEMAPDTGRTVVDDLGANWWDSLGTYPVLWGMEPGRNILDIDVPDSSATTVVRMRLASRWQAAW